MRTIQAQKIRGEMTNQPSLFDRAKEIRFNGSDYVPKIDDVRLTGQILRVFNLMRDAKWRTLDEIAQATGDPHASISAQLRHLRKDRFGAHKVSKRSRGERASGLYEYQLITPP